MVQHKTECDVMLCTGGDMRVNLQS